MRNKGFIKTLSALVLSACMVFGLTATAFADNKVAVDKVSLNFDTSDIEVGASTSNIIVTTGDQRYSVVNEQGTAVNLSGSWTRGKVPEFKVTVKAESGYRFDTKALKTAAYYTFSGDSVSFLRGSGSSSTITLTVRMPKLSNNVSKGDLTVNNLSFNNDNGDANWDTVDAASKYEVKLYKGRSLLKSVETANNYYSFAGDLTSTGSYTFKVRASYDGSYGSWATSEVFDVDSDFLASIGRSNTAARWIQDNHGWWYRNGDGSYTVNNWQFIDGKWYFFNSSGYMVTGWINWKNVWYYCGSSGAMLVNTTTPDGYRVNADGAWVR